MNKFGLLIEKDVALELMDGMEGRGDGSAKGLDSKIDKQSAASSN